MVALSQISYPYGKFKTGKKREENPKLPLKLSHMKEGIIVGLWLLSLLSCPILVFFLLKTDSHTDAWVTRCLPHTFISVQLVSQPSYKRHNQCLLEFGTSTLKNQNKSFDMFGKGENGLPSETSY